VLGWEPKVKLKEGLPLMEEDFRARLNVPRKHGITILTVIPLDDISVLDTGTFVDGIFFDV